MLPPSMYCQWVNRCEGVLGTGKLIRVNTSSMFITHLSPSYCRDRPTGCSTEASKNNLSMQWSIGLSSPRCLADWRFNMKLCISGLCDCRHVLFYYVSSNTDLKKVSTSNICHHIFKMDLQQSRVSFGWLFPGKCQSGGIEGMSLFPLVQRFCSEPGQSSLRRCSPCFPWCAPWCTSPD